MSGGTGVGMAAPSIPLDIGSRDLGTGAAETAEALLPEGESLAAGAEDAFGLDAAFRRRVLPAVRFLFERYWRVDVTGARHVPSAGPALLVANHSGALPFDGVMIVTAVLLIPARTFLICGVLFHAPGMREKFLKIWPFLLLFDGLWSLAPFLLLHHISYGLALACMTLLVYSPFAQRSLILMGAGQGRP